MVKFTITADAKTMVSFVSSLIKHFVLNCEHDAQAFLAVNEA